MGKRSRDKGAAYEREIARRLNAIGIRAERALNETRDGNTGDIDCSRLPIVWQLKCQQAPSVYRALEEAKEAAEGTKKVPVAVVKRSGRGSTPPDEFVALPIDDFFELIELLTEIGAW